MLATLTLDVVTAPDPDGCIELMCAVGWGRPEDCHHGSVATALERYHPAPGASARSRGAGRPERAGIRLHVPRYARFLSAPRRLARFLDMADTAPGKVCHQARYRRVAEMGPDVVRRHVAGGRIGRSAGR